MNSLLSLDDTILQSIESNRNVVDRETSPQLFEDISGENENQWQDDTFLNEAFTQINNSADQGAKVKCFEEDFKEQEVADLITSAEDIIEGESPILDRTKESDSHILKRNVPILSTVTPKKKYCTDSVESTINNKNANQFTKNTTSDFFGLPSTVKTFILNTKGIKDLYKWQEECLSLEAVKNRQNLIYALPTSGGKTLVAEILMLKELICHKKNAIFILPFVAIVQEKVQSLAPFALELGFLIEEYAATRGSYPPKKRRKKNSVYICTIEKAMGLINSLIEEKRLHEIGIIVVDELHLLGENGGRGAILEGLLTKVLYVNENVHIVGMSATIGNLEEIARFLNAHLFTGNFRPVEIKEYVKCGDSIWLLDVHSPELLTDLKKINYRYSEHATVIDPDHIGGLVMDVIPNDSCLVFCSSRKNCENVALLLSKVLFKSMENHKKVEKQRLINALKTEEGLCPVLNKTIMFGVAYHHSGLTSEERKLLEDAFRAGTLCVICCTSTLAAGVNLPARRVILRSPYVGNQFLNLSRYKQMIGRAGRAGMGTIGESILICKNTELSKVKELLVSKMDDSLSTLHIEKDKGINNLLLSAILLSIATTRNELHNLAAKTLLNIQEDRLNISNKKVTDDAIGSLLKSGIIKLKASKDSNVGKTNISVAIPSQHIECTNVSETDQKKKTIVLTKETQLELCKLGRAAMKGCIDMNSAYILYQDLKMALKHLVLVDHLHLLYLVTPYDIISQVKPVNFVYYDAITNLTEDQMMTARLLGINEAAAMKIRDGLIPKGVEPRVMHRFYITLILHELWTEHAVYSVSEKYQVSRGILQNLLNSVSVFASAVVRFCEELEEFSVFKDLLGSFSKKLSYCCPLELEALMELPLVKIGRARQLYNAGYRTVQSIAAAKAEDLQEKIPYLHKKSVIKIIEAAKLLILEKVEDLKDEAEDVLEGISLTSLSTFTNY